MTGDSVYKEVRALLAQARDARRRQVVHTGNRPHIPTTDDQEYLARRYGQAEGYKGAIGGWIHKVESENGSPVLGDRIAHGWGQFYHVKATSIHNWAARVTGFESTANPAVLAEVLRTKRVPVHPLLRKRKDQE